MTNHRFQLPVIVDRLEKVYGQHPNEVYALHDISLTVHPGEIVILMGPSGSGKTTLLSIIGCIISPSAGKIYISGEDIGALNQRELSHVRLKHIGFIFQEYNLFSTLTATQNVMVALDIRDIEPKKSRIIAMEALDAVGIANLHEKYPANMSGGQKQRLAIARAIASKPDIILADEPTAALDALNGQNIMALLKQLTAGGRRSAIVVTHDPRIQSYADRIIRIEDGRISEANHKNNVAPPHGNNSIS